jgi:hypothetical protein
MRRFRANTIVNLRAKIHLFAVYDKVAVLFS